MSDLIEEVNLEAGIVKRKRDGDNRRSGGQRGQRKT